MPSRPLLLAAFLGLGAAVAAACASGSSPLAKRDEVGGAGAGGAGAAGQGGQAGAAGDAGAAGGGGAGLAGQAGSAGSGQGGAGQGGAAGSAQGGAGSPPIVVEPDGPAEFSLLNGVVSAPSIRLCWLAPGSDADAAPQPAAPLLYGDTLQPSAPPGVDPATTAMQPHIVSGDLDKIGALGCKALLEAPPQGVVVTSLPVLPAGTTTAPRSRLAIAVGCAPGAAVADINSTCALGVDPKLGNLNLLLVDLSRIAPEPGFFGVQVVHASTALPALRFVLAPSGSEVPLTLVSSLSQGQIAPRPPYQGQIDSIFGASVVGAQVRLQDTNGTQLLTFDMGPSLTESGLSADEIVADGGLVGIVLGPRPGSPTDAAPVAPSRLRWLKAPRL